MIKYIGKTNIGKEREKNQDSFFIPKENDKMKLFILADGMGGYSGGEIASEVAVNSVKSYIETNFEKIKKDDTEILKLIKSSIEYSNLAIYEKSKDDEQLDGMGTTVDVALIYHDKLYIGHIGDSRIYKIRGCLINQITKDHSYVEQLIDDGTITKEEAKIHPKKNMLTKAVGCTLYTEPDLMIKSLIKNDIIVMCSDGLTNLVSDEEIYNATIDNKEDLDRAAYQLIDKANANGGYDNITTIIIKND